MVPEIDGILANLEQGRISRRQALGAVVALAAAGASPRAQAPSTPFQAVGTNHVALNVTDVARSRDFYRDLLGMRVSRDGSSACFLDMKSGFLALFRSDRPGLNHYCLAVEGFEVAKANETLKAEGLNPRWPSGSQRIYFDDPDGIEVQLSSPDHSA